VGPSAFSDLRALGGWKKVRQGARDFVTKALEVIPNAGHDLAPLEICSLKQVAEMPGT
jgi:hypothetical protein